MRILCIDYGEKRLGVAVSDPLGLTGQAVEVIDRKKNKEFEEIGSIIGRYEDVSKIIVGLPINLKGEIGPSAQKALAFMELLKTKTALPVIPWDERSSTVSARETMHLAGLNEKKQRKIIDKLAAAIILQSYLDSMNKK